MLVVDASLIAAAVFDEEHTTFAQTLLADELDIVAPDLIFWELSNIAWKKLKLGYLGAEKLVAFSELVEGFRIELTPLRTVGLVGQITAAAVANGLTAYDAGYLMTAQVRRLPLATIDRRLTQAAVAAGLTVHSPFA